MLELARRGPTHHFQPKWLRMRGARGGWSRYYDSKADAGKSDLKLGNQSQYIRGTAVRFSDIGTMRFETR